MKILFLPIKKKWYDMIGSGEKLEEYREIKAYWVQRLCWHEFHWLSPKSIAELDAHHNAVKSNFFDAVMLRNGYGKKAPSMLVECKLIRIGYGKTKWGAEPKVKYFIIVLYYGIGAYQQFIFRQYSCEFPGFFSR